MPAATSPRATRGVLYVHSCPPALCPHVEWAVAGVLGVPVRLAWTAQPAAGGALRAESGWYGRPGSAGRIVTALQQWHPLRLEVTEDPSPGLDGERYALAPGLGLFRASTSANGDVVLGEDRVRALLAATPDAAGIANALDRALGTAWDAHLEPYRAAGDGAPVRWLHATG